MPEQFTKSVIVGADVERCYAVWKDFENFPDFMQNIESVKLTGDSTSHWVMQGPMGGKIEWDANTTRLEENQRIAWSSTEGDIKTSGQVTFQELPKGQTEVTVTLQYVPPAGKMGQAIATLFDDPERQMTEDLRNFKRYIEDEERR